MSKFVDIKFKKNGYVVTYVGFLKNNGEVVYKFNEEIKLVEELGQMLIEKKIEAREK